MARTVMFTSSVIIHAHRRRLPQGNGGDCPRRNTPHRAPPGEDFDPPYDIKLVFVQKITLVLRESTKTVATRAALLTPICIKSFVGWGFSPHPTRRAYSAPSDTLGVFRGPTSKKRRGRKGREEGRERREQEMRKRRQGRRREGVRLLPEEEKRKVVAYARVSAFRPTSYLFATVAVCSQSSV